MAFRGNKTLKRVVSIFLKLDLILLIVLIVFSIFAPKPDIVDMKVETIKKPPLSKPILSPESYMMYFFIFLLCALFAVLSLSVSIIANILTFKEGFYIEPYFLFVLSFFFGGLSISSSGSYLLLYTFSNSFFVPFHFLFVIFNFLFAPLFFIGLLTIFAKVFYNTYGIVSRPIEEKEREYNKKVDLKKPHFKNVFENIANLWYNFEFSGWLQAADIYFELFEKNEAKIAFEKNSKAFFDRPIANALVVLRGKTHNPSKYLSTIKGKLLFTCSGKKICADISRGRASVKLNDKLVGIVDFANKEIRPISTDTWKIIPIETPPKVGITPTERGLSVSYRGQVNGYRFEKNKSTFAEVNCSPHKILDEFDSRLLFSTFLGIDAISDNEKALLLVAALLAASLFILQVAYS